MANTILTWGALCDAVISAGVIIVDDDTAVYLDDITEDGIGLKDFAGDSEADELYCFIPKDKNTRITSNGSSMWANMGAGDMQLSFYKTWVVADDPKLERAKDES